MHLYPSDVDLEKVHADYLPKSSLPCDSDYGGICDTVEDLHEHHTKELADMREYFSAEEKLIFG